MSDEQEPLDLRLLRMRKGWTQLQLAEKANLSNEAISRWEHGESSPRIENAKKLADALGVSVERVISAVKISREQRKASREPPPGKYRRIIPCFIPLL